MFSKVSIAANELAECLNDVYRKINKFSSIGCQVIDPRDGTVGTKEFYEENHVHRGPKSMQIDELFKYHVINKVSSKGGIFSRFRNWSKNIHSKLKSIVSKSRSEIAKIEKIADTDRKKHWLKFYTIGIDAYNKLQKVFDPESAFNKKFIENGNKKSRLTDQKIYDALDEIKNHIELFSSDFRTYKKELGGFILDSTTPSNTDSDKAINDLVSAINSFSEDYIFASGVQLCEDKSNNKYVKRGPKSERIEEIFKATVIKGVIDRGNKFGGFRRWSDGIYSKLKSITSKAHSKISKIEKIKYAEHYYEYWNEFYKVELEALKKLREIFNPNNAFNKKYLNNKKSRLSDSQVEETLEELYTIIGKQIVDVENEKEQFVEAIAATSN